MDLGRISLRDIAKNKKVTLKSGATLRQAVHLMRENGRGASVVMDGKSPFGIITERDVVGLLHSGVKLEDPVSVYTKKNIVATSESRNVGYALNLMLENDVRRLVVTGMDGKFLGLVSQEDLIGQFEDDFYRSALKVKHLHEAFSPLIACRSEDPISRVLDLMVENDIGAVPVIEDGVAVGIITEKDILKLVDMSASVQAPVREHMSSPVVTATGETVVVELVRSMAALGIRRVVVVDGGGRATGVISLRDLLRNLEFDYNEYLERKLNNTKDLLNLLPEMMVEITDLGGEQLIVWANQKILDIFGAGIIDRPVDVLVPSDTWKTVHPALKKFGKVEDMRFKSGDMILELSGFYLPMDNTSEQGRIQLIIRDMTEEVMQTITDPLTKIFNRRHMNELMARELERSRRNKKSFSVALLDLDDFKSINDHHGHHVGDEVLRRVAGAIDGTLREYDMAGRYGGEEFLILMPEIGKDAAAIVAERVREIIGSISVAVDECEKVNVTGSLGVATYPEDGTAMDEILVTADKRMYSAKHSGKNRVCCPAP